MKRSLLTLSVALAVVSACGSDRGDDASTAATPAASTQAVPTGTFDIDGTSYSFRIVQCDLTGSAPDGMFLRGGGELPDGRRMGVEVERLAPEIAGAGTTFERASVEFGNFMDGDGWEARATSFDGERWVNDATQLVLDGPLIRISGDELVIAGTYKHASKDSTAQGSIRATCPAQPPA
jgi:hypothetical protein